MDDSSFNPFQSIDKKRFPKDTEDQRRAARALASKPAVVSAPEAGSDESAPEDEAESFSRAMHGVTPMHSSSGRVVTQKPVPAAVNLAQATDAALQEDAQVKSQLLDLVTGKIEFSLEHTDEYIRGQVIGLDSKTFNRLKTGWYPPEAHLDLHGKNAAQAYEAFIEFLRESYLQGRRCLLLIPGKGNNSPEGYGVLRERLKVWLTRDPCKRVVLAFCTAQPRHGGAGALYVLLRKRKGEGKIRWDRTPVDPHDFVL